MEQRINIQMTLALSVRLPLPSSPTAAPATAHCRQLHFVIGMSRWQHIYTSSVIYINISCLVVCPSIKCVRLPATADNLLADYLQIARFYPPDSKISLLLQQPFDGGKSSKFMPIRIQNWFHFYASFFLYATRLGFDFCYLLLCLFVCLLLFLIICFLRRSFKYALRCLSSIRTSKVSIE